MQKTSEPGRKRCACLGNTIAAGSFLRLVLLCLAVAAAYSAAESSVLSRFGSSSTSSFSGTLLHPGSDVWLHRTLIFVFLLGVGAYAKVSRGSRRSAEMALVDCRDSFREEIEENESRLQMAAKVVQHTSEGVVVTDAEATILSVNPAFTAITGYSSDEAVGENPRILKSDRHPPEFYEDMWRALVEKGEWSGEIWNRHKSGRAYPEWLTISAIRDEDGETTNYISVFHDLTDLKQREDEFRFLAHHDPLTGLANRLLFDDRLAQVLLQADRLEAAVAVIYADIDDFKLVNDKHGHAVGDLLLQAIARRLSACVRDGDTVARHGGDEFVIILSGLRNPALAGRVVECIRDTMTKPFQLGDLELSVALSLGLASFPDDASEPGALVHAADTAMYRAKEQGKNGSNAIAEGV